MNNKTTTAFFKNKRIRHNLPNMYVIVSSTWLDKIDKQLSLQKMPIENNVVIIIFMCKHNYENLGNKIALVN